MKKLIKYNKNVRQLINFKWFGMISLLLFFNSCHLTSIHSVNGYRVSNKVKKSESNQEVAEKKSVEKRNDKVDLAIVKKEVEENNLAQDLILEDSQNEIFADLTTEYNPGQINTIQKTITKHTKIQDISIQNIEKRIKDKYTSKLEEPQIRETKKMDVVSLISFILTMTAAISIPLFFVFVIDNFDFDFIMGILIFSLIITGFITAIIGLTRVLKNRTTLKGLPFAIISLALSGLLLFLSILIVLIAVSIFI